MTPKSTGFVDEWLAYAKRVVACEHIEKCRANGGDPDHAKVKPVYRDLRYPGYFGPSYRRGGILCIAWVHNAKKLFYDGFPDVEQATNDWKRSAFTKSADYVAAIQRGYVKSIPNWGPWDEFFPALEYIFGMNDSSALAEQIAYANFAKCWTIPRSYIGKSTVDSLVMNLCQSHHPMAHLVNILEPSVILSWAPSGTKSFDLGIPKSEQADRLYRIFAAGTSKGHRQIWKNSEEPDVWHEKARLAYVSRQVADDSTG